MDALTILLASLLVCEAPKDAPREPDPLSVKLEAKLAKVKLNLEGMTEDDYKKAAKAGTAKPLRTFVNVVITNTGKKTIAVKKAGFSPPEVKLVLTGPSVVESRPQKLERPGGFGQRDRGASPTVLKPGESTTIRLTTLTSTRAATGQHLYATQPGKYLLQASVKLRVYLDYESIARPGTTTALELKAAPVELTVE